MSDFIVKKVILNNKKRAFCWFEKCVMLILYMRDFRRDQ